MLPAHLRQSAIPEAAYPFCALMCAIIAAAGQDRDEMTVLLIHGEPAAVIAPCGHERRRRPGATAGIAFDQTAPDARLVLKDTWGGSIRMSTGGVPGARQGRRAAALGGDGADRGILTVDVPAQARSVRA